MKNKKILLIVFVVVGYFSILLGITSLQKSAYLIIDNNTKWKIANGKWTNIENVFDLDSLKFKVYYNWEDNGILRANVKKNQLRFLNNKNEIVTRYGEIVAVSEKANINFHHDFQDSLNETELSKLNEVLKSLDISGYQNLKFTTKMINDFDKDGKEESLISVTNNDYDPANEEKYFSIVYYVDENETKVLAYDIQNSNEMLKMKSYSIYTEMTWDKKSYIILSQNTFGERIPYCHYVYDISKKDSMLITSCINEVKQ